MTPRRVGPPIDCRSWNWERDVYPNSSSREQRDISRISGLVSSIRVLRVNHLAICRMRGAKRGRSTAGIHVRPYITPHTCDFEDAARYLRTFVGHNSGRGSRDGVGQQHDNSYSRLNTQGGQIRNGFVKTKTGSDKRRASNGMK